MYILDTDFFIHAYNYDFPPDADHDGFWDWLDDLGQKHDIVIPEKVFEEVEKGNDGLPELISGFCNIRKEPSRNAMPQMPKVLDTYGNLTQQQLEVIDRRADPYCAAHGLDLGGIVVTNEIPKPNKVNPLEKKIPDICSKIGVLCIRYPRFLWDMKKTS